MSDKEWERFFDLMEKIVNHDGLAANEKASAVRAKAVETGNETSFEEFTGWFAE